MDLEIEKTRATEHELPMMVVMLLTYPMMNVPWPILVRKLQEIVNSPSDFCK